MDIIFLFKQNLQDSDVCRYIWFILFEDVLRLGYIPPLHEHDLFL